ncbi:hypothetical protein [Chryseobacterium sp. Mn2064]|uniref:hypothetical protein n=1 Tax=Chryseobacterium sp. Mn2064 TaxID=3395263 RepID=UPI003BBB148B
MKKAILFFSGCFMLLSCSSERELEKQDQLINDRNSDVNKTITSSYKSPYKAGITDNYGLMMRYINKTNYTLVLTPYVSFITEKMQKSFNLPTVINGYPDLTTVSIPPFNIGPNQTINNQSCGMVLQHSLSTPCPSSLILYDFSIYPSINFSALAENSKIHYFKYEILAGSELVQSGYLKQKFMDDYDDISTIPSFDPHWIPHGKVTDLYSSFQTVTMYNAVTKEICLTNEPGTSNPVLSEINFTDPYTSSSHTLKYYTTASDARIELQ